MQLTTLRSGDGTTAAVLHGATWRALPYSNVGDALRSPSWREDAIEASAGPSILGAIEYAPLIPTPGKVICCGHNYAEHIAEMGHGIPEYPTLFTKFADTLCGPADEIELAQEFDSVDWEAELAVVIGQTIRQASIAQAREAIVGYTVANDISIREWQRRGTQWLPGKAFDRTTPVGPLLVTADELDPAAGLRIRCEVNDEVVQEASTSTLVFGAAELVRYISQFTTLRPGDIILTGTPGGVGDARVPPRYLADGDLVTTTIEGIGALSNRIRMIPAEEV